MKCSINNYVSAFMEAVKNVSQEKAVRGLVKLLEKTGDIKHSGKIIEAVYKKVVNENGGNWVDIETARESASVKSLENKFSRKDRINLKINSELIAGVRITVNGEEELNNTLQNKLIKLFK